MLIAALLLFWNCAIDLPEDENTAFPAFGGGDTLDIVTWNLNLFPKNGSSSITYMEKAILDMQPDIVAFQELRSEYALASLAESLINYRYFLGEGGGDWGLAYLYRSDLLELDTNIYEIYTNLSRPFPRPPLVMEANWKGARIIVINNHLKASGDGVIDPNDAWDEERRRQEALELLDDYIKTHFDDERVIVLGDLNDELTDPRPQNVFQLMLDDTASYQFTDLAIAQGSNLNWSYPSWPSHIDHIAITNELFDVHYQTKTLLYDTYLEGRWTEYYNHISDHRPLSVTLILQGGDQ
jgi:endonuclease/exonuclease/phosphatase family metal-dependent hydrolase